MLMIMATIMLFAPTFVGAAPLPVQKSKGQCPSSYFQSGGACVPMAGTKCWTLPKPSGSQCPSGTLQSGNFCRQIDCRK
jgi:hypothetical protein